MLKQRLKNAWFAVFRDHPLTYPGRIMVAVLSQRRLAKLQEDFFTGNQTEGLVARMVRAELNRQFYSRSEGEQRRLNRERFWGGRAGVEWHEAQRQRHAGGIGPEFLRYRAPLVEQLKALTAAGPQFTTLCEIGTGNGLFLEYLSRELPQIARFVGIDLNREQIERNRGVYAGTRLEFVADEVDEWLRRGVNGPTIFVAAGTLECFTQGELVELFNKIRASGVPTAFGLCEPVNIDLSATTVSMPRGNTMYSHNYPHLLRASGYDVFQQHTEPIDPAVAFYQMVVMVALANCAAGARA